jgi:diguanylate cyclase (GGDEF)-like protein
MFLKMNGSPILQIVRLCRTIDEAARDVYMRLHVLCKEPELSEFWKQMSDDEAEHLRFWQSLETTAERIGVLELFEDSERVIAELEHSVIRSKQLLDSCEENYSVSNAFVLACRMEFYLLHPAFELLFHVLGPVTGELNPESEYESHIDGLISMLRKHCRVTPELELLGETLSRLWHENKTLALQASRDELTGLLNRRGFHTIATQFAHLAQRNKSAVGVMMIDIDSFKAANDRLGHRAGDEILKSAANTVRDTLRASDVIGRYGGDEFLVFLPSTSAGATPRLAELIRCGIEAQSIGELKVSASIGVSEGFIVSDPADALDSLIQAADEALMTAKQEGRNRVYRFIPEGDSMTGNDGLVHVE